ncbi:hypothetical protein LB507_001581 [Fusarium sp. FIESC RH6]|nr:hypothetical protein LB507_001581 [Fusarium sp. FIESC RH6]
MQSQHTYQAGWANHNQNAFPEMEARASEQQFVNNKARELVAKSLDAYYTASALAQSVEAMTARMQINESNGLDRHKADFDALMTWAIEEKPAFVKMLTALGDELPPKLAAALHNLHRDSLLRHRYNPEKTARDIQEELERKLEEVLGQDKERALEEFERKVTEVFGRDYEWPQEKLSTADSTRDSTERLQEKLSAAENTIESLKKDLAKAKADSARQAEELAEEKETSRKHGEKIVELLDELADFDEMMKTR